MCVKKIKIPVVETYFYGHKNYKMFLWGVLWPDFGPTLIEDALKLFLDTIFKRVLLFN